MNDMQLILYKVAVVSFGFTMICVVVAVVMEALK